MALDDCPTCDGRGTVPADSYTLPEVECPACGGSGKAKASKAEKADDAGS